MSEKLPLRRSCRGLLVDGEQILLAQHNIGDGRTVWVGPGGGVENDESLIQALARELHEETGLVLASDCQPRLVWVQTAEFSEMNEQGYAGVANYYFWYRSRFSSRSAASRWVQLAIPTGRESSASAGGP